MRSMVSNIRCRQRKNCREEFIEFIHRKQRNRKRETIGTSTYDKVAHCGPWKIARFTLTKSLGKNFMHWLRIERERERERERE